MGENQLSNNASGQQQQQSPPTQQNNSQGQVAGEVDVTEDITKLLNYVKGKADDDPHDTVLSRIKSRLLDIVERIEGATPPSTPTPQTPVVNVQGAPTWKYIRVRGGRIVKRQTKEQVAR